MTHDEAAKMLDEKLFTQLALAYVRRAHLITHPVKIQGDNPQYEENLKEYLDYAANAPERISRTDEKIRPETIALLTTTTKDTTEVIASFREANQAAIKLMRQLLEEMSAEEVAP